MQSMFISLNFTCVMKIKDENYTTKYPQAYTQSNIELNYIIIYHLPTELKKRYSENIVLYIVKPLYGLAKAKNH